MNNSHNAENGKGGISQEGCWQKRSKTEKILTIVSILALLLILALLIALIVFFTRPSSTCVSPSCVHITSELLGHMNHTANPCDDFYQFACGNFLANTQLDADGTKGVNTLRHDEISDRIRGVIEEPETNSDPRSLILAKKLFKACTNVTTIEDRGLKLIRDSLRQIGGWPVLEGDNWKERDFDWKAATYKLRELGYRYEFFIEIEIEPDKNDPYKKIIELNMPFYPFYKLTEEEDEEFFNYMVNVSVIFGADRTRAINEFREVVDFMKTLFVNPTEKDDESKTNKYNPFTIAELRYQFSDIPWLEYFNRLQFPAPNISYDQIVSITNTDYFIRLINALRRSHQRVVANYICWRIIREHAPFLTDDIWETMRKYALKIHNYEFPPRNKWCSDLVHHALELPVQAAYVRRYVPPGVKNNVGEMFHNIKDEFKEVVTDLKWMDEETRVRALERLATSHSYIAYPNDLLDEMKIENRYLGYNIDEDNLLSSILNINYYATNEKFQKLHEPVEKDEELDRGYATYSSSYYTASDNTITIPAGHMQGVVYDPERPESLNYGALGAAIGHEIFHTVFESCQRNSDYYDWISTPTLYKINEKLSCIAMHYGQYFVPEIGDYLNSSNTKHEDMADIAGVKLAYNAYKKWESKNGHEQNLPGLDYTPKQLFWISSAVRFCKKSTPKVLESYVAHSFKSPSKYRVIGALRNSEDFARDFNCPSTSYMNNVDKCDIW